jgi:NAD(P)-dependent dehydrogenase (short-subunit alcohol dehydrogenase family)
MTRLTSDIFDIRNTVVCVTGAAGLIGETIANVLYVNGARLVLCDLDKQKLEKYYGEWDAKRVLLSAFDITDVQGAIHMVKSAKARFGRIDVLVNNAAIDAKFEKDSNTDLAAVDFADFPLEKLQQSVDVNVVGTIKVTQAVVKLMIEQQAGNIINLASTYSLIAPNPKLYFSPDEEFRNKPMDYLVTKSFIPNFTKYLATHYAKNGIRCNALAPHAIDNNHDESFKQAFSQLSPLGRMSDRSELEGAFIYLISSASSYMTGHTLVVDGGWTAW